MDIDMIKKQLLGISKLIDSTFDCLQELSYAQHEDSKQFADLLTDLSEYLISEAQILDYLDTDTLNKVTKSLMEEFDDNNYAYRRLADAIEDRIMEETLKSVENDDEESEEYDYEGDEFDPETDIQLDDLLDYLAKNPTLEFSIDIYYIEELGAEKETIKTIDGVSTIVIKEMVNRIKATYTDNRQDEIFKKRMLHEFDVFKYYYFTLDSELERIGVKCRFNVDRIPDFEPSNTNISAIAYNQCVTLLDKLYFVEADTADANKVCMALFNIMSFEEYLKYLTPKSVDVLLILSEKLRELSNDALFGVAAHKKLVKKKEEEKN